jgi:flagellar basal body-associated protein FliL
VAEEKKKEADGKAEAGKKKRLPPLVMIAVGAIVGGAGVVFAVPPKVIEKKVEEPRYEEIDVTHPDPIQHEFNPRTKAGKSVVRVALKFVYTVREDLETEAFEKVKANWEEATSNTLLLLKTRSMEELGSETGTRFLEKDLIDDLDHTLFPAGPDKVAKVSRVLWTKWLAQ